MDSSTFTEVATDVGTKIGAELGADLGKELRESALLLGLTLVVVGLVLDLLRTFGSGLDRQILRAERDAEQSHRSAEEVAG